MKDHICFATSAHLVDEEVAERGQNASNYQATI
jgi:hypothetical protein